jgi:hypothetical protein
MAEREDVHFEDRNGGIFEPDVVLPAQFFTALRRRAAGEGERRLMIAVLEDAVHCYQKYAFASDNRGRTLFREAEEWILEEEDAGGPGFSFVTICDVLELDPDYVRAGLRQWRERRVAEACASGRVRSLRQRRAAPAHGPTEREASETWRRASGS